MVQRYNNKIKITTIYNIQRQSVNSRATVADKVSISLKGDIVLPWDRQVLGEWNYLFFFKYEIRNVSFNIQYYISIILLDFP
jgi:hypothetical protein